jgi:hypothetical protein
MSDTAGDRMLTLLVIGATVALASQAKFTRGGTDEVLPSPVIVDVLDERLDAIARAVAVAEGYYAPGEHDGHSLPYALNNPGALKKPALGAAALPTWKETGVVMFPSKAMGWAALRHQVRAMLTGASRIYDPSDTLTDVGIKYAEGDANWGRNVAATLGVPPDSALANVASEPK